MWGPNVFDGPKCCKVHLDASIFIKTIFKIDCFDTMGDFASEKLNMKLCNLINLGGNLILRPFNSPQK